jgi:transposase InsO family protein
VIIDLCSRFAVGWAMSERITDDLTLNALGMALTRRHPPQGLLHHEGDARLRFFGIAYHLGCGDASVEALIAETARIALIYLDMMLPNGHNEPC